MALFGGKRGPLQTALAGDWNTPQDRDAVLAELRRSPPKSAEVVPLLWHKDGEARRLGAELVLARPDTATVKAMIEGMARLPAATRNGLLPVLARLPPAELRKQLDSLLKDGPTQLRLPTWEIAVGLPDPVGEPYRQRAIFDAPAAVRLRAVDALLGSNEPQKHLDILLRLAREPDAQISAAALKALAAVRDPRVLEVMLGQLAGGEEASRRIADEYLRGEIQNDPAALRRSMIELLPRASDEGRRRAVAILLQTGAPEEVVLEVLQQSNQLAGWMRTRIIEALRSGGEPVLRATVQQIGHSDPEIRTSAIMMLAEGFEDPRLVEPFCRLLQDPDWWLRVTACQVLGRLGDERAVPALVQALQDEDTRWAAVDALAQIGAAAALQPLSQLLRNPRPEVRLEVLQAFAGFSDQRLLQVVQAVRDRDPDGTVRQRAAEVLRQLSERLDVETAPGGAPKATGTPQRPVDRLLIHIRELGASDLHLSVGEPPVIRLDGTLQRIEGMAALTAEQVHGSVLSVLTEDQQRLFEEEGALDFCYEIEGVGRYRANAFRERLGDSCAFRVIPNAPPTFGDLRLPEQLRELLDFHQGVILLSGPSGCGKSTTLTALINLINETKPIHLLTLEDPIEFVHPPKLALVNQREVKRHTQAFANGLRAALREDPDVVVVGELRDAETIRMALEAAETGHLVITTLHTTSAVQTIDRLVDSFPPEEQAQVRMALSESLKYVVCQRLVPRKGGKGRVAVFEVLKGTLSVGNMIRKSETFQIPGLMQIGRHLGMRTLDQALTELVEADLIAPETAFRIADKPETFEPLCDPAVIAGLGG